MHSAFVTCHIVVMADKHKSCSLSVDVKWKIIKSFEDNPTKKKVDIVKEFGIPSSTLATILKRKGKFEEGSGLSSKCKKLKYWEFKVLEECILKCLKQCRDKNVPVRGPIL